MPVLLIRHANAGPRKEWADEDRLRPLSTRGRHQATGLVAVIEAFAPNVSSLEPYVRCVQTVEPLADRLSLQVEAIDDLAEGNGPAAVALVRAFADEKVALCTHGDVIPDVLVALADEDRLDLGPRPRQAKGSVWVLDANGGHFTKATYIPPPN